MPTSHDPFAPHAVPVADGPDDFPRRRLFRAGVGDEQISNLAAWYDGASPEVQAAYRESFVGVPDEAIRGRYTLPDDPHHAKVGELQEVARAVGAPVHGTKADLIDRLTAATGSGDAGDDGDGSGDEESGEDAGGPETGTEGGDAPQGPAETGEHPAPEGETPAQQPDPTAVQVAPQQPKRRSGGTSQ